MNDLDALFGDHSSRARPRPDSPSIDLEDLGRRVGPASAPPRERRVDRDARTLVAMVGERSSPDRAAPVGWTAHDTAPAGNRPSVPLGVGGRVSRLSAVVAVLAIVGVVAAVSLGLYRQVTANPVDAATTSLVEAEAQVQNDLQGVETAVDLYAKSADEAEALVSRSGEVLTALDGKVDAAVLTAATSARDALSAAVTPRTSFVIPVYDRGSVDLSSLTAVARATDRARAQRETLPELLTQVRAGRAEVVEAIATFETRLDELAQRVGQDAPRELSGNAAASSATRDAVNAAAAAAAQVRGAQAIDPLASYASAVAELRADHARVIGTPTPRQTTPPRYVPTAPTSAPPSAQPTSPAPSADPSPAPELPEPTPQPSEGADGG